MSEQLRGTDELMQFFSKEWFDFHSPGRTPINETMAMVVRYLSFRCFCYMRPAYNLESVTESVIRDFTAKYSWSSEEKELAMALLAQHILNSRIKYLQGQNA